MLIALILTALVGLLILAVGILARLGRLPRNGWVGVRLPSTLESDAAWRTGHRAGAVPLMLGGLVAMVCSVIGIAVPSENAELAWLAGGMMGMVLCLLVSAAITVTAASAVSDRR